MNDPTILFLFRIALIAFGAWALLNENKLIKTERKIFRTIKRMVKK